MPTHAVKHLGYSQMAAYPVPSVGLYFALSELLITSNTLQCAGKAGSVPQQSPNLNTPKQEVVRILSAKSHYTVLEVDSKATEDAIKKARRMKSLLVHPDKVGPDVKGANEAFGKVTLVSHCLSPPSSGFRI